MKIATVVLTLTLFAALSPMALAKPKPATKVYPVSCETLWTATKKAVSNHYDVLSLDDKEQAGSFTTGSIWSGIRPLAFHLEGTGKSCTVYVTGHFSGITHNDKGDLFKRIEEQLKSTR